jgi:MoxR-like ATPase
MPMKANVLQKKSRDILTYIQENLYFNRPDLEVKGETHNAALLFGLLTGLVGGKELIVGEPGLGKTTSAEYIGALLYRLPLGSIWEGEVSGHPEQTEEKIIGRPDLGQLNKGIEEVVWSSFALLPVKIVDEINRLPETKQSMILDGVDRGNWSYLNKVISNEEFCLFATANYHDRGTNTIVAPLLDRFDVMVESKHPGPNISWMIGRAEPTYNLLRDPDHEKALQSFTAGNGDEGGIERICDDFGAAIKKKLGVPTFGKADRKKIREQASALPFDEDASALMRTLLAELSFCCKHGQKRSNEICGEGCHYTGYLCYEVRTCPSNRFPMSVRRYAQCLAWLLGDSTVDVEHLRTVIPYAAAHRIQWRDDLDVLDEAGPRTEILPIHRARQATREVYRRYREQGDRIKSALAVAYRIFDGEKLQPTEGDHPIYSEIMRDLGIEPPRPVLSD